EIVPETWLPTCTVVTACRVPVADTVLRMEPRSIFAVMYSSEEARRPHRKYPPTPPTRTTPIAVIMSCFLLSLSFIFFLSHFISFWRQYRYFPTASDKKPGNQSHAQNHHCKSPTDLKTPTRLSSLRACVTKER